MSNILVLSYSRERLLAEHDAEARKEWYVSTCETDDVAAILCNELDVQGIPWVMISGSIIAVSQPYKGLSAVGDA